MNRYFALFAALLICAGISFADIVPSGFSASPATFKSGVSGTLSFTLTNTGTNTITGIDLFPSGDQLTFFSSKVSVGALGPGASTTASIPFKVSENAPSGVLNLQVSAYWIDTTVQGYKTFSYPLTISSSVTFQLSSIAFDDEMVNPGDAFNVNATLTNTGGAVNNVRLTSAMSSFTLGGSSQIMLGNKADGQSTHVQIPLIASTSLAAGVYSIPITVTYEDGLGATQTSSLSIPVTIYPRSSYLSVSTSQDIDTVLPGQKVIMKVNLTNVGSEAARVVRVSLTPTTTALVMLDSAEKYVEEIPAGSSKEVTFQVGINSGTQTGFYPVDVAITYSDAKGSSQQISQQIGLQVSGISQLDLISSASPSPVTPGKKYTLSMQISNIGTESLKSVRVHTEGSFFDLLTSPDSYIGALIVDDYSTVTYSIFVHDNLQPGAYPVNATITFRDAENVEKTVVKTGYIYIVSQDMATLAAGGSSSNPLVTLVMLAIVAVLGYFGYKRFFKAKKKA